MKMYLMESKRIDIEFNRIEVELTNPSQNLDRISWWTASTIHTV